MKPLDTVLLPFTFYQFHHLNGICLPPRLLRTVYLSRCFFPVYEIASVLQRFSIHRKTFRLFDHLCLLATRTIHSIFDCPILDGSENVPGRIRMHCTHSHTINICIWHEAAHTNFFFRFHNSQYKAINIFFPLSRSLLLSCSDYYKFLVFHVYSPLDLIFLSYRGRFLFRNLVLCTVEGSFCRTLFYSNQFRVYLCACVYKKGKKL